MLAQTKTKLADTGVNVATSSWPRDEGPTPDRYLRDMEVVAEFGAKAVRRASGSANATST